ncbi:MAG: NAD(+)/NADH kinase [Melioribacter sp.]|nr:NAD(+)/NADH kinase [Melioribacter sp.]
MILGIIPNITKTDIVKAVDIIAKDLFDADLEFYICNSLLKMSNNFTDNLKKCDYLDLYELIKKSDIIISIGGDGTMLNTAYLVRNSKIPIIGVNLGKLGFLAELDVKSFREFIPEIKSKNFIIEERIALSAFINSNELYAINDIVIDKGAWSKMIELTIKIDEDYVSTFAADGIIIATPTGSTGYSLSAGGPIITPKSDVITLSPIAPHTLTMRPLVISSEQKITIIAHSLLGKINVSCDGQRSEIYDSPLEVAIAKSDNNVRLIHSKNTNYFEILRSKLFWGLDVRKVNN